MTISTTLLFSRAVTLMGRQQTALAELQEKVSTGKELVRPSDSPELAVNIARIKSSIGEMDAFKNSLNSVNDRLRIEESYLDGAKDVLIKLKQLTLQGANASMSGRDKEVLALQVDELTAEIKNLANGTDANGNYLFAGSRVTTPPYAEDSEGTIRYFGDNFRPNIDYTANRRSAIGRNGIDVFRPVLSGEMTAPTSGIHKVELRGTLETGDIYSLSVDDQVFEHQVRPGDSATDVIDRIAFQINEASSSGLIDSVSAYRDGADLIIEALDGVARSVTISTQNTDAAVDDLLVNVLPVSDDGYQMALEGTTEPGDQIVLSIGSRSFEYVIPTNLANASKADVMADFVEKANQSGLFSETASFSVDSTDLERLILSPLRQNIGDVQASVTERTSINDQGMFVSLIQEPRRALPERVEFFESLQEVSHFLRNGTQDQVQGKLDHLDQMLDIVTLALADIGSEMGSIEAEISINEDLKLQLETTLSGQEDLDFTTAITELQAKMMSLEAAQSSFAKISQLSVFDYIR